MVAHFAEDASIFINRGEPHSGGAALEATASGFHAEFPDLNLTCDGFRLAGDHKIYLWTLEGRHAETGNFCTVSGWEE